MAALRCENEFAGPGEPQLNFPFPYKAYSVQEELMKCIFHVIDKGEHGVCMVESPTGTGKSLSIICSSLHWLFDHFPRNLATSASLVAPQESEANVCLSTGSIVAKGEMSMNGEPSWVREHFALEANKAFAAHEKSLSDMQQRVRNLKTLQKANAEKRKQQIQATTATDISEADDASACADDQELLLDWIDNGAKFNVGEPDLPAWKHLLRLEAEQLEEQAALQGPEARIRQMLSNVTKSFDSNTGVDEDDEWLKQNAAHFQASFGSENSVGKAPQIIYCSRTHSQLSQFVHEIEKTVFKDRVRVITLGSRKQLCNNHQVLQLHSALRMNDACLQMQKQASSSKRSNAETGEVTKRSRKKMNETSCPYLEKQALILFR